VSVFRFEWDEAKNLSNRRKHGVSFEDGCEVFDDPLHVSVQERTQGGEQRWQTYGVVRDVLLLIVAHTVQEQQEDGIWVEVVRIISARHAKRKERHRYEEETG
jgi:uncharacterized protein